MNKLLVIGDAACDSGFSRATHEILAWLSGWDRYVIGINYRGDPHKYPYPIYPAYVPGCKDLIGTDRISELVPEIEPDLIFIQNDPWNFPRYLDFLRGYKGPIVGMVAVDGKNCAGDLLNRLSLAIFWTEFARKEAIEGGFTGKSAVIPLGVDIRIYHPMDKYDCRRFFSLPDHIVDGFIVGNVNRNQPRKRLDLTVAYFCEWVKDYQIDDAYLFLHIGPTGENGYDCKQLMKYYGLSKRLIRADPGIWSGIPEQMLAQTYNCFDIMITTTQGEGFGLTTLEGMACGIPQIVPQWSALGEWTKPASHLVPCTTTIATPGPYNPIGGVMDRKMAIFGLNSLYHESVTRRHLTDLSLSLARDPRYRWSSIGSNIARELRDVMENHSISRTA